MLYRIISTVFFVGYFPFAPGTVASAFAMLILLIFKPSHSEILMTLVIAFVLGVISSNKIEKKANEKDPSYIVIDEFAGYLISVFLIPLTTLNLLLAFLFFRFFDIIKPPPIRQIEKRLKGGLGIMMDDIIAGLFSNLLLRILLMLS